MDRQQRRLNRLADVGIHQANVLVHDDCRLAFDDLRPYFSNARSADSLASLAASLSAETPVNVAQVKQLSPFRYPGGKTWLVPVTREWLRSLDRQRVLLEPFAGGAMVGLSAANEGLVDRVELVELDDDVAAVWEVIINGTDRQVRAFCDRIASFSVTRESVVEIIAGPGRTVGTRAFRTIVKNRCQRGGIMAPGAGLVKAGEGGRGLVSRWYPQTLIKRIMAIRSIKDRVGFTQGDAFSAIERHAGACLFIDPPYTAAGKRAGSRLYTHSMIDHERLFDVVAANDAPALLTYDDTAEVRAMSEERGLRVRDVAMKSTHHAVMRELTIFKGAAV